MKPRFTSYVFLAALWSFAASQAENYTKYETPRSLSLDLLFPKKDTTYKSQFQFPIVFALDPAAFWNFDFLFEYYIELYVPGEKTSKISDHGGFTLGSHRQSDSPVPESIEDPMLIINSTRILNNITTEMDVLLRYSVGFTRSCNDSLPITYENDDGLISGPLLSGWLVFKISNSGDALLPDLSALGNCSQSIKSFSILGEREVVEGKHSDVGTCPVVQVEDTEGHCGRKMDKAMASRVSDYILNETCPETFHKNSGLMWPNPTATTKAEFCGSGAVKHAPLGLCAVAALMTLVLSLL